MSTIFFNTETSTNPSWSVVCEGLNSYYAGPYPALEPIDLGGITDHEQKISSYVKIASKIGLYKTPETTLAIAVASPVPGQTLGVHHLDMALIKEQLSLGVPVVYFGYIFTGESASQTEVVERSLYFGRRTIDNVVVNLETGDAIEGTFSAALWMAFYKFKDCDVYYAVLNDNLVDSTIIRQEIEKVDFSQDEDKYCLINTNDGNFKEAVFKPSVTGGQFFGKNIIIADSDTVTVDVFGLSKFHNINGSFLQDKDLPAIDMEVACSTEHTIVKNKITVDLTDTNMATLSYLWVTGTELDFMASDDEKIRYDFVILKK